MAKEAIANCYICDAPSKDELYLCVLCDRSVCASHGVISPIGLGLGYKELCVNCSALWLAAPKMLEALKKVDRAIQSDEWKRWEGLAMTMVIRHYGANIPPNSGYQGEQFMPDVREAIALAERS